MTYRLHPEAALEHERQVAYYEDRSTGLGRRYHVATMQAIGKAVQDSHQYKVVRSPDLRQVQLRGFPFAIVYRESGGIVQVLAVAHHRRHPNYWAMRA